MLREKTLPQFLHLLMILVLDLEHIVALLSTCSELSGGQTKGCSSARVKVGGPQ